MADVETSLQTIAEKVGKYIDNLATLTIETKVSDVTGGGERLAARTVLKLDGDSEVLLPTDADGALRQDLLELHQKNVAAAMLYRSQIVAALLQALTSARGD